MFLTGMGSSVPPAACRGVLRPFQDVKGLTPQRRQGMHCEPRVRADPDVPRLQFCFARTPGGPWADCRGQSEKDSKFSLFPAGPRRECGREWMLALRKMLGVAVTCG